VERVRRRRKGGELENIPMHNDSPVLEAVSGL